MVTILLFIFDMLNMLSVPWWLYMLAVIGFPVEAVIIGVILENN